MNFQELVTHNPILAYLTSGAIGGLLGGLLLLLIQTILKQGVAYQYRKKLEELKHDHIKTLRDISHEYEKKLKDFNYHYDEKLAKFNEQITIQADYRKLDLDRKIHDFSLYSTKRYEVYPDFFKRVHRIQVILWNRKNLLPLPSYIRNIRDVKDFVKDAKISLQEETISHFDELLTKYETVKERNKDKEEALNEILNDILDNLGRVISLEVNEYLSRQEEQLINFYAENVLYLSGEVASKGWETITKLGQLIHTKDYNNENLNNDLNKAIEELEVILRKELSVGDYSHQV